MARDAIGLTLQFWVANLARSGCTLDRFHCPFATAQRLCRTPHLLTRLDHHMTHSKRKSPRRLSLESLENRLAMAIYLSEIHPNPLFGSVDQDQYVEIRSDRETSTGSGTYLVVVESASVSGTGAGKIHTIFDLSNQSFGSNGFLVLAQQGNRYTFDPSARVLQGTTSGFGGMPGSIFQTDSAISNRIDFIVGSNSYLLIQSNVRPLIGDDIDAQDDGIPDGVWNSWTVLDGVSLLYWIDSGSNQYGYAPITFRERGVGRSFVSQTIIDCEQIAYAARVGGSTGFAASDWLTGNTQEFVSNGVADFRLTHGTFGTPRPYFFAGRDLNHIGSTNFVGSAIGTVFRDDNADGIQQASETGLSGVRVIADTNANGIVDSQSFRLEPDLHLDGQELTNVGVGVTLTSARTDNTAVGFVVRARNRSGAPTNSRLFASEGIPWFSNSGRLRMDFYRPAQQVQINFSGTSTLTPVYGRLEAFDSAGQSLGFVRTNALFSSQSANISLSFPEARIAYAVAYCDDSYLNSSPFGELDDLRYFVPEATAITTNDGRYHLTNLSPGSYRIAANTPSGMILQNPSNGHYVLDVAAGLRLNAADFGYRSNRNPTFFNQTFSMQENASNGHLVGTVLATDSDAGQSVEFAITSGDPDGLFSFDGNKLVLQKNSGINFETKPLISLVVLASDSFVPAGTASATIQIAIQDVNDPPTVLSTNARVDENAPAGTFVVKASATDEDVNSSQAFTFRISDGNTGNAFAIDPSSGNISVAGNLNFETQPTYFLVVEATDQGSPAMTGKGTITISLKDVNEPPTITTTELTFDENATVGTVVGSIQAIDADQQQTLQYTIIGGTAANRLEFVGTTNQVRVTSGAIFDFETEPTASLAVRVTDSGSPSGSVDSTITLRILNKNDPPIILAQSFTVDENSDKSNAIGPVVATDQDVGQNLRYAIIGGPHQSKFRIDATTGQLFALDGTNLDFETSASFALLVEASDDGVPVQKSSASITVHLRDKNDPPTMASQSFTLAENSVGGFTVGTVTGSDQDANDTLTYQMDDQSQFTIEGSSGVVKVKEGAVLNFEAIAQWKVPVSVRDQAGQTASTTITVNLSDVNDAPRIIGSIPLQTVSAGKTWSYTLPSGLFADEDANDTLRLGAFSGAGFSLPSWIAFNASTSTFSASPTEAERGSHVLLVNATDKAGSTARLNFTLDVIGNKWHNYSLRQDVDNSNFVSPIDSLHVLNYLNLGNPVDGPSREIPNAYLYDVNNDKFVTPLDSLLVLNYLNLRTGGGEGEVSWPEHQVKVDLGQGPDSAREIDAALELLAWDRERRKGAR